MQKICKYLITGIIINISISTFAQTINYVENKIVIENQGWRLKGDLILVKSKIKFPIVLLLNKANGDRGVYGFLAKQLADIGISSLRIDLRGHGESINRGKFVPFDSLNNAKIVLDSGYTDIIAAYKYLTSLIEIDSNRIGIVGASYSGEDMMIAARKYKYAKCYIALSPGSFSDESLLVIDSCTTPILFIKSNEERSMQGFEKEVFLKSKRAEFLIVAGKNHATDILISYPETNMLIANWFKSLL